MISSKPKPLLMPFSKPPLTTKLSCAAAKSDKNKLDVKSSNCFIVLVVVFVTDVVFVTVVAITLTVAIAIVVQK